MSGFACLRSRRCSASSPTGTSSPLRKYLLSLVTAIVNVVMSLGFCSPYSLLGTATFSVFETASSVAKTKNSKIFKIRSRKEFRLMSGCSLPGTKRLGRFLILTPARVAMTIGATIWVKDVRLIGRGSPLSPGSREKIAQLGAFHKDHFAAFE